MYGDICLSSQVGTGSSSHDLAGMSFSSLTTSDTVAGLKELKGDTWRVTSTGGLVDAVDNRMPSTSSLKNLANWSAESFSKMRCDGGRSRASTARHRVLGLRPHEFTVSNQNVVNFQWNSRRCASNCCHQALSDSAVRWRWYCRSSFQMAIFWRVFASCIFSEPRRVQHVSDPRLKFALRPHHVWKYDRHPICDGWD